MNSPAEEHDEAHPLHINIEGHQFRLWTQSAGVSSSGEARVMNAHWVIEHRGTQYGGWAADVGENIEQVKRQLLSWYRENQDRLGIGRKK